MELWILNYRYLSWEFSMRQRIKRWLFCRHNQHEMVGGSTTVSNSRGVELHTEYVRCKNCNVHYFPDKKHRDQYIRIQEREKAHNKNIVEMMKKMYGGKNDS